MEVGGGGGNEESEEGGGGGKGDEAPLEDEGGGGILGDEGVSESRALFFEFEVESDLRGRRSEAETCSVEV